MGKMLGDHFTKPLQGSMFSKYHAYIQGIPDDTGYLYMWWGEASEPFIPIPQYFFGCNAKYMGTIPCSNVWDTIPCSNGINIQDILRIQSGTDRDWENSLNNIYCEDILNKIDRVDDCVCVNGCVRYDSPMTSNTKPLVRYANVVWGMMRKQ